MFHTAPGILKEGVKVFEFGGESIDVFGIEVERRRCFRVPGGHDFFLRERVWRKREEAFARKGWKGVINAEESSEVRG